MAGLLITLLIILVNGFFVGAEFALVKVRGSQIDVLIKQGNKTASRIKHVLDNMDNYLSACQFGITIASLALGWVAEPLIATQLFRLNDGLHLGLSETTVHAIAIPFTFFLITTLHIVVGEQAPKSMAIRDPLRIAGIIIHPLYRFYKIFKPLIRFLNALSLGFLRLCGIDAASEEQSHSEEELRMIIAESEEEGEINASERELIQNVFDFDNRQVSEIMMPSHKMYAREKSAPTDNALFEILQEGYSRVPVYEETLDNMVGRILVKDLVNQHINQGTIDLGKLIRPLQFVPEQMKIADCLKLLQKAKHHIAIVISEHGNTLGLITIEDILEELVGDIHDEGDEQYTLVQKIDETTYLIDAAANINDVNEMLPVELPTDEDYSTTAGYLHTVFGRIPSVNEQRTTDTFVLTVTKRNKQRIEQVRLDILK